MTAVIKNLQGEILFEHELVRYFEGNTNLICMVKGGYLSSLPEKGKLYNITISDETTGVSFTKLCAFSYYNFVLDGSGTTTQISDNSLIFLC